MKKPSSRPLTEEVVPVSSAGGFTIAVAGTTDYATGTAGSAVVTLEHFIVTGPEDLGCTHRYEEIILKNERY
jgi:hypothetical protein